MGHAVLKGNKKPEHARKIKIRTLLPIEKRGLGN